MSVPESATLRHFHAVRFYENQTSLCRTVVDFLAEGFNAHQPALMVATPAHSAAVLDLLIARGFDVKRLQASGELLLLDARDTLATFMSDGMPDATAFKAIVPAILERLCAGRGDRTVRAYGEMVDVLWKDGKTAAAIRLEVLWNQLAMTHSFSLLCGYAMGNFYKGAGMQEVCAHHSHVIPADSKLPPAVPRAG
jgi:MEDS: MEthanogen/methylotroph, DcmR Sensory domain